MWGGVDVIRLGVNNTNRHHTLNTYHVPRSVRRMLPVQHHFPLTAAL